MFSYPPQELWPEKIYNLPDLSYPDTFNACYELLDANLALGRGSAPAIFSADSIITYAQLADEVMRAAGALRRHGVKPGDGVLIRLLNRPNFIVTFLALLRIGAVALPTAPLLRHREIGAIIQTATPILLVSETDLWDEIRKIDGIRVRCVDVEELRNGPLPRVRTDAARCTCDHSAYVWQHRRAQGLYAFSCRSGSRLRQLRRSYFAAVAG